MIRVTHDNRSVLLRVDGRQAMLTSRDARKLAAALVRHADALEGVKREPSLFERLLHQVAGGRRTTR